MIINELKINSDTIYRIEIVRLNDLISKSKYNDYEFRVYNEEGLSSKPITKKDRYMTGIVKHKYKDGLFVLLNKVNKQIIIKLKNDKKEQTKIDEIGELIIRHNESLRKWQLDSYNSNL